MWVKSSKEGGGHYCRGVWVSGRGGMSVRMNMSVSMPVLLLLLSSSCREGGQSGGACGVGFGTDEGMVGWWRRRVVELVRVPFQCVWVEDLLLVTMAVGGIGFLFVLIRVLFVTILIRVAFTTLLLLRRIAILVAIITPVPTILLILFRRHSGTLLLLRLNMLLLIVVWRMRLLRMVLILLILLVLVRKPSIRIRVVVRDRVEEGARCRPCRWAELLQATCRCWC